MTATQTADSVYVFDRFRLDGAKRLLFDPAAAPLPLMPKAFDILFYLVTNSGRVVGKDELMSAVWPDTIVEENNLTQNISAIRRILGEKHGENRFIATIPGRGYKFVAKVERSARDAAFSPLDEDAPNPTVRLDRPHPDVKQFENRTGRFWLLTIGLVILAGLVSIGILWRAEGTNPTDGQIASIAILPFKPITGDNRDEALEMGMADTLISKLSGDRLKVRPLAAVRRFASPEQDPVEAGRRLGVEAVLDGGVQIASNRVRISAKLIRVSDGRQIWAGQFDEQLTDIFAVQDSISERVTAALRLPLSNQSKRTYTQNVEAYQLFVKGKFHSSKLILPEVQQGISYYQQAIAVDPSYALAYVELSNAYRAMVLTNEASPGELMPKARAAAEKAIELDSELAAGWAALASCNFWYDWDWHSAEEHFKKSLALDPSNAQAHAFYAHFLSNTGRHDDAIAEIKRARQIDPLDLLINAIEGQILCFAGRNDESITALQAVTLTDPNFWLGHLFISRDYIKKELWDDAIAAAVKAMDITGGNSEATGTIAFALAKSGRRSEVQKLLAELDTRAKSRFVPSYTTAQVYLAMGERSRALELLEKAFAQREPLMVFLKVEPKWDELRNESRFINLIKRMNFD